MSCINWCWSVSLKRTKCFHVSFSHHIESSVVRPSIITKNLLLWKLSANLDQSLVEGSFSSTLPQSCPTFHACLLRWAARQKDKLLRILQQALLEWSLHDPPVKLYPASSNTTVAATAVEHLTLWIIYLKFCFSVTTKPNATKFNRKVLTWSNTQNCVRHSNPQTKMATTAEIS